MLMKRYAFFPLAANRVKIEEGLDPLEQWSTPLEKCQSWAGVGFGQFTAR